MQLHSRTRYMLRYTAALAVGLALLCSHSSYGIDAEANPISVVTLAEAGSGREATDDGPAAGKPATPEVIGYLQWPLFTTSCVGQASEQIYGEVYVEGLTPGPGQAYGVAAQAGYGPTGSDPSNNPAWNWFAAAFVESPLFSNNDEYIATLTPDHAGAFDYCFRFSHYGRHWVYADANGSADGYSSSMAGRLYGESCGCPKWQQEPDCWFGLDLPSYALDQDGEALLPHYMVADDWRCDGRPITAIRWWGSYIGWPEEGPPSTPEEGRPLGFRLTWWTDDPVDVGDEYSQPATPLTNIYVDMLSGDISQVLHCTVTNKTPVGPYGITYEREYRYDVKLEEPWEEKDGNIYWLSVEAVYDPGYPPRPQLSPPEFRPEWGWSTAVDMDIIDDAVVWQNLGVTPPPAPDWHPLIWPKYPWNMFFTYASGGYAMYTNRMNKGPSMNMAFELFTDICPSRCKKWEQPPDVTNGGDMWSWRRSGGTPGSDSVRADDFISDGRPITDIHWWGSYSNWKSDVVGSVTNKVAPPSGAPCEPLGFWLTWYRPADGSASVPGVEILEVFAPLEQCHQVYYASVTQNWVESGYMEHEYQFYVDLLEVAEPWYELKGSQYWISIEAEFPQAFSNETCGHGGWGWTTTDQVTGNPSAVSNEISVWHEAVETYPGVPFDLAFELTTTNVPATNSLLFKPVGFTSIDVAADGSMLWIVTTGRCDCGYQVLQISTNLLEVGGGWVNVKTNPVPKDRNVWIVAPLPGEQGFHRVLQAD